MTIGLSTYAFFWRLHETAGRPLGWRDLLDRTADLGCELFQFCDYGPMHEMTGDDAREVGEYASRRGIALELGTRGLDPGHMLHYLDLAVAAGASLVRSMVTRSESDDAESLLGQVLPRYEERGVKIALETYEQIPVDRLLTVVRAMDSEHLGVCLDPANSVAALEPPERTVRLTADYVNNVHVKDFAFTRKDGWIGFTLAGARLGEGLLDYDAMVAQVRPGRRGINQVVEHWLVWQGDSETTCALEDQWTQHSLDFLNTKAVQDLDNEGDR